MTYKRKPKSYTQPFWRAFRAMSNNSRALFVHGNYGEYERLRRVGDTLGLNKSCDIVKALVDLYYDDYADRFDEASE